MIENKRMILDALSIALQLTRAYEDLQGITYEVTQGDDEYAVLNFSERPSQHINITADSGIAIIRDVVSNL